MKTYDHKTKKFFAEKDDKSAVYTIRDTMARFIGKFPPELIENSSDREEVVEKDWISKLYLDIGDWIDRNDDFPQEDMFRATVEQHIPKEKKFTREDIDIWRHRQKEWLIGSWSYEDTVENFLKEHNLLFDTD